MSQSLETCIDRLASLLADENAALTAMDFAHAGALLAPKQTAADALADAWRACTTPDAPRAALVRLGELADENRRLLGRAMRVQRRVLDLVARAARAAQPATRYGARGEIDANDAKSPRSLATRA